VLVAYAKLALKADLAASDLASDPWFTHTMAEYFPQPIRDAYGDDLAGHPLRDEIIVNSVVNSMVNRGGITFAYRAADETGGSSEQIARAYVVAREVFGLRGFVAAVEATDTVVPAQVQTGLYLEFLRLLDRAARWFVQRRRERVDIGAEIDVFSEPIAGFSTRLSDLLRGHELTRFDARVRELEDAGVPEQLARRGAGLLASFSLLDVVELSRLREWPLEDVAGVHFALSDLVHFDDALTRVTALPQDDRWGSMARAAMREDLYAVMVSLAASVIENTDPGVAGERVERWLAEGGESAQRALGEAVDAVHAGDITGLATISVALRRLRSLVR
jgi:glutamate dehydrogenase